MPTTTPLDLQSPWSRWKSKWADTLITATVVAGMEAAAFLLFLYLFVQDPHRLLTAGGASLVVIWCFNVGVCALNAHRSR